MLENTIVTDFTVSELLRENQQGGNERGGGGGYPPPRLGLRIFSVNVTKSAGNCGSGHIYLRNS